MDIIKLNGIKKYYGSCDCRQNVLKDISMEIKDGGMVSIMGPSGSGKSTLLNMLGLLDVQSEGEYFIDGKKTSHLTEKERAYLRNEKIGFVFQGFHLMKELSALENVQLGLILSNLHRTFSKKIKKKELKESSLKLLESLGLKEHVNKKPSQLSGGQQQRVAIARALINDPKIILADEPTGALDQKNGKEIMDIFTDLNRQGKTVIVVTHDREVASCCKEHLYMLDGKLIRKEKNN